MSKCIKCGSYAFNLYKEDIDQGGLCDVHYWQGRAHRAEALAAIKQDLTPERPAQKALDKMAENARELGLDYEPAQGCDHCNHALYAGTKCKSCGHVTEQPAQQEPVAQHRNLHNHMMIVGSRAFDAVTNNGRRPASRKQIVREICKAIQSDKNLLAKLSPQPAQQQEPFTYYRHYDGGTQDWPDEKTIPLYTSPQPAQPSKPLPFNKEDMEGLDINQRLGFKLGWKSAEEAHNIKGNT